MEDVDLFQLPEKCLYEDTWDRHHSLSLATTKGLRNPPGENNCFLNSAVQVFWHLDVFRRSLKRYSGHVCMGNSCIFCNLKVIFTQLQYSDKSSLHPNALRRALAEAFVDQHRFQLGHMDDAAECFENILRRIHFHIANGYNEDQCNASHCLTHRKFSLTVSDQVRCVCGASSEPMIYSEIVHYVSVTALVSLANKIITAGHKISPSRFGSLLRNARSEGDIRDCPKMCGRKVQICRTLYNQPDVVSIGLVWNSDCPSTELISAVMMNIRTTIYLQDMFHSSAVKDLPELHLVGLVCYYGKHYSTFVFHTRDRSWYYFDDATVKEMGTSWESVAEKCCRSHYQPLLLLYANPNGTPIHTAEAPQKVSMAPGFKSAPNCIPRSQSADLRRAITPNPDMHSNYVEMQNRRAITPGPDTCHRYIDSDRDSISSANTDHQRQPSFLMAISGHDDTASSSSQGQGSHYDSFRSHSGPVSTQSSKPNSIASETDDPNLLGEYVCSNGMLQASFQQTGNTSSGVYNVKQAVGVERVSPPNVNMEKAFEIQKQESFRKGNKVPADLIRYQVDNGYQKAEDIGPLSNRYKGGPSLPGGSGKEPGNAQLTSHNSYNIPNRSHQIIKPTAQNMNSNYYENVEGSPLHSGLATLPRTKEQVMVKRTSSSTPSVQPPSNSRPPSTTPNSLYSQHRQTPAKLENSFHGYYNENKDQTQKGAQQQPGFGNSPFNGQMVRSASAHSLSSTNSRTTSESSVFSQQQPPQQAPVGKSYLGAEDNYDQDNYIDRKTVKNVMKRLHMKSPLPQRKSLASHHLSSKNLLYNGDLSKTELSEALTLEIPYDNLSLESHRDSGYGSSDRNSSSSTSSITMDSHYFHSVNKLNLKNLPKDPLHEAQYKHLPQSKDDVYYMTQKRAIDDTVDPKHVYLRRKGSVDSGLDGPMYPTDHSFTDVSSKPSAVNNASISSSSQAIRSTLLQQGKKLLPDKPMGGHIVRDARTKAIISTHPNPSPANGNDLITFKSGIQNNMNSVQTNKGLSSQDEYVQRCCVQVDDLMDQCVLAETKSDLRMAICHCDKAIGCCKQVLALVNIPAQAVNYVQNKLHSCMIKRRTLYNKYSQQQQLQTTTTTTTTANHQPRPASVMTVQSTSSSSAENPAVRNCMAGPVPLTSTSTSASSSYSMKGTPYDTAATPINGSCLKQTSACETNSFSKYGPVDTNSKTDFPMPTINNCDSRKSADIYGTLPKNQPRHFESSSASREAEVYQEFLTRQKLLNQQNGYGPSSSGRAFTPTPYSSNSLAGYSNSPQVRPSSTIPMAHSRTDSMPESVASCDSTMTTVPGLHNSSKMGPSRMNKQEIRQLLQHDMVHRQGNKNLSSSSINSTQNLGGSRQLPNVPSQYNPHIHTSQPNIRDTDATNGRFMISSSTSVTPQPMASHYTIANNNPIPNNSARPSSANSAPQQISGYSQGGNLSSKYNSNNNQPSERQYNFDEEPSRPSVKDLASKFEDVVSTKKNASADNLSCPSAVTAAESSDVRHSFRMRSKSESSSTLPKPALSKHQFQQGTRPRKSVTFCDSIALIALTDDTYPYEVHTTTHRSLANESDSSSNSSASDDGLDGVGASISTENPSCSLCQKRQVIKGQTFCQKCSFYMSRFQPSS